MTLRPSLPDRCSALQLSQVQLQEEITPGLTDCETTSPDVTRTFGRSHCVLEGEPLLQQCPNETNLSEKMDILEIPAVPKGFFSLALASMQ